MESPSDKQPLIEVKGLSVAFGRRPIVHDVDLTVGEGETIALVGANGSGKSTLLRGLLRLEIGYQGEGKILGRSLNGDDPDFNAEIGYVAETLEFNLPVPLRKIANFYRELRPQFSMEEFDRVTELFKLSTKRAASDYSRGQKMQFAFALAVAAKPRLLILDEVTAVLDIHVRDLAMREIRKLVATGASALIATNILTEVVPYASRLVIMEDGIVRLDTLLSNLAERYLKFRLMGDASPASQVFRVIKGAADGSFTCLVPREKFDDSSLQQLGERAFPAPEPVTAEDVYLYHCQKGA